MVRRTLLAWFTATQSVLLAGSVWAQPPPQAAGADEARIAQHIEAARRLSGTDVTAPFEFFCIAGNARPNDPAAPALVPAKLFDNLYVAGNSETVVHAITTSEGIILIDSGFSSEVETVLIPGLTALGLDPADVKLVLLGHGHADHYGGAAYFQTRFGARIGTTEADWDTIAQAASRARPGDAPPPKRDLVIHEGRAIVLGDTSIVPVEVPGHTPGALAFIFPVFDDGVRHVAGLFGGTVLAASYTPMPAAALRRFDCPLPRGCRQMGVDVEIQNHPIFDNTSARLAALSRQPGEPHPLSSERTVINGSGKSSGIIQANIIRRGSRQYR